MIRSLVSCLFLNPFDLSQQGALVLPAPTEKRGGHRAWLAAEVEPCLQIMLWPCFRQISTWYSESSNLSINPESVSFHHVHSHGKHGGGGWVAGSERQLFAHTALFCPRPPSAAPSQPGSHMNPSCPDSRMFFLTSPVSLAISLLCNSLAGQSTSSGVTGLAVPALSPSLTGQVTWFPYLHRNNARSRGCCED